MSFEIITRTDAKSLVREIFLEQHPESREWFEVAWDVVSQQPRSQEPSASATLIPSVGITGTSNVQTRQLAMTFAFIFEAIVEVLPTSAEAIHNRLMGKKAKNSREARIMRNLKEALKKKFSIIQEYVLWENGPEAHGLTPVKRYVDRDRFALEYLPKRGQKDIFVYNGEVTLRGRLQPEKLEDRHVRLLCCFLIFRGQAPSSRSLFKVAWKKSDLPPGCTEQNINDNYLSPALCDLRDVTEIPDKKRGPRYVCNARVSFLVVLPVSEEAEFAGLDFR